MRPKKIRPVRKTKTPEELFRESGLIRKEWNAELKRKAYEASKAGADPVPFVLLMIDADGKSVLTKLTEGVARQVVRGEGGGADENRN